VSPVGTAPPRPAARPQRPARPARPLRRPDPAARSRRPLGHTSGRPAGARSAGTRPQVVARQQVAARRARLGRRARVIRLAIVVALLVVAGRLVEVQVLRAGYYSQQASQELTQPVTIPALRGTVTDRDGVVLMTSEPTEMVVADDFQIRHPLHEARALAPLLHAKASNLVPLLSEKSGYVPLVRHLAVAQARKVAGLAFPGITTIDDSINVAPDGNLAGPVLGGVDAAGLGDAGLEEQYNALLAGHPGHETLLESPTGVPLSGSSVAERTGAVAGTGLELTLDEPLQYVAEQDLAREILTSHAQGGEAVVMDVKTGQVLAMANLVAGTGPTGATSPSAPSTSAAGSSSDTTVPIGSGDPVQEAPSASALTQLYEPGSVFKLVTFSAALGDGIITPTSTFSVPDQRTIDGDLFHDATPHPTQQMTATQILAQSSNIGTSLVAQELGETRLLEQVKQLGFGATTGLHFPGASPGLLVTPADWSTTDYVSLAIGQTDAVTPMQVLDAYNAIADDGEYVAPKLVRATVGSDGTLRATPPSATHRVVSAGVSRQLTQMLEQVVDSGTGVAASVPGYLVAGKTGTSQTPSGRAGYIPGDFDASFVGFAPADHPVLSAIVILDHPTPIYGGAVAAPVFSQIMGYALHRYDVPTSQGLGGRPQATVPTTAAQLVQDAT
jgi:cell division protein FtsI (penicillin-binding protein 3)